MSDAARRLAERLAASGARRIAFLGLAKNAGKTTALVATLAALHRLGVRAGATSAGRDGEDFDAITGEPKPRFRLWPGQVVASAESTFAPATLATGPLAALPFETRFGGLRLAEVAASGDLEVVGPTTASETAATAEALERAGARVVLLDGAFGRRAFASARVADGLVVAAGMSAGRDLRSALDRARDAMELAGLSLPAPGRRLRRIDGALTPEALRAARPVAGETLLVRDFASVFLPAESRRRLAAEDVALAVERPARVLAVVSNPAAPGRPALPPDEVFAALAEAFPRVAVADVVADLWRAPDGDPDAKALP